MIVFDSLTERQIYDIQVGLRAIKQCSKCHRRLAMVEFYPPVDNFPFQSCRRCTDYRREYDRTHPRLRVA